jgi:subtilase family serine protease
MVTDLQQFDQKYGLPDPKLTRVNQTGGSTLPATNAGWGGEIALDVEWAHAIAPGAQVLLVEATSNSGSDLYTAVNFARNQPKVVAVSMSWGSAEFSGETGWDSYLTTAGHAGVTFVAFSGDNGWSIYPAISPNIVRVGGTTLTLNKKGIYTGETAWSGSGGGFSKYESRPSYQAKTISGTQRGSPDVAYDADPNTGVSIFYNGSWRVGDGTSARAPQWAVLIAIADQLRSQNNPVNNQGSLDGVSQTLPALYAMDASDFHHIDSNGWDTKTGPRIRPGCRLRGRDDLEEQGHAHGQVERLRPAHRAGGRTGRVNQLLVKAPAARFQTAAEGPNGSSSRWTT